MWIVYHMWQEIAAVSVLAKAEGIARKYGDNIRIVFRK